MLRGHSTGDKIGQPIQPAVRAALDLSGGLEWSVVGEDPFVIPMIHRLVEAMQLDLGKKGSTCIRILPRGSAGEANRTGAEDEILTFEKDLFRYPTNEDFSEENRMITGMWRIACSLACGIQGSGGILLHSAFAEWKGCGVIFPAPGGTGKTTVSRRLPAPWHALSDDNSLIVPAGGGFRAHPWPTWSRFSCEKPGGAWNVRENFPLKAIFFLQQADRDRIEPVARHEAAIALVKSNEQALPLDFFDLSVEKRRALRTLAFQTAADIAKTIPVFRLHLTLEGSFWELVEHVLAQGS